VEGLGGISSFLNHNPTRYNNPPPRHTHTHRHVFHYIVEDGITYLCMADDPARRRLPFAFLEDIKGRCVSFGFFFNYFFVRVSVCAGGCGWLSVCVCVCRFPFLLVGGGRGWGGKERIRFAFLEDVKGR
jgi:hypothetical protein